MESKLTGKTIKKVGICTNKVVISFTDGEKMDISKETYSSFYLFEGKNLSMQEYKKIKDLNDVSSLLDSAFNIIKRGLITENKLKEKLYAKGASKKQVDEVMTWLKKHDLINDEAYIEDYLEYADEVNMGQYKIKEKLYNKGISKERIEKIRFSESKEKQKAKKIYKDVLKKYDNLLGDNKRQHIYNFYISQGFSKNIASEMAGSAPSDDKKLVKKSLNKDFEIAYKKFSKNYENKELFEHIFRSLKAKGYTYQDIKKKWEEKCNELY